MTLRLLPVPPEDIGGALSDIRQPGFKEAIAPVFVRAMLAGYATSPPKGVLEEIPGSRTILFSEGLWRVHDMYVITPLGDWSGGTTHVSYGGVPVQLMQYSGMYPKNAIRCLKAALLEGYTTGSSVGGRGPSSFFLEEGGVNRGMYDNRIVQIHDDLPPQHQCESGIERVLNDGAAPIGFHTYSRVTMVP